jgi:F-type H+-transporting ATPase subunit delta
LINSSVSRRYAKALLMIATERQALEQYEQELEKFKMLLQGDPKRKELMDDPRRSLQEKKEALDHLVKNVVSPIVYNFLRLIVDKRREAFYLDIIREYGKYADDARNVVDAEVRSAVQLTDKDYRDLQQKLSKVTGKNVRLKSIIDTSLVGGIKVKIGDTVIDGSVTKKLYSLKNWLQQLRLEEIGVNK